MAYTQLFLLSCCVLVGVINANDDAKATWDKCKAASPLANNLTPAQQCTAIKDQWSVCAINSIKNSRELVTMGKKLETCISDEITALNITCTVKIDASLLQQAALDKCNKENDVTKITDVTKKCENLDKIMGCVFTRLPPGDTDAMKTSLQTEVTTLASSIGGSCNAPTIDKAYVQKMVFGACEGAALPNTATDKEKCDALKEKAKCTVGKVFKSFSGVAGALGTITDEVKKEAANLKDCKADAAMMMNLARSAFMSGASTAQVSFFVMGVTLAAVAMMR